jgi:hypothetical protein
MFGSLLKSVVDLTATTVTIVAAPVKAVVDVADAALQPVAEAAKELGKDIASLKD